MIRPFLTKKGHYRAGGLYPPVIFLFLGYLFFIFFRAAIKTAPPASRGRGPIRFYSLSPSDTEVTSLPSKITSKGISAVTPLFFLAVTVADTITRSPSSV